MNYQMVRPYTATQATRGSVKGLRSQAACRYYDGEVTVKDKSNHIIRHEDSKGKVIQEGLK